MCLGIGTGDPHLPFRFRGTASSLNTGKPFSRNGQKGEYDARIRSAHVRDARFARPVVLLAGTLGPFVATWIAASSEGNKDWIAFSISWRGSWEESKGRGESSCRYTWCPQPFPDLVGILAIEAVADLSQRMPNHDPEARFFGVENALLEVGATETEGASEIALHAEDRVTHEPEPPSLRRGLHDIGRLFEAAFKDLPAERGSFLDHRGVHRGDRFAKVTEPAVLGEKDRGDNRREDQPVPIDVAGMTRTRIHDHDSEIPAKQEQADDGFGQEGAERGFAESGHAAAEHEKAERENAGVKRICQDGKVADDKVDRAPDDACNRGVANGLAGANGEERLVLGGIKNAIVSHRDEI